MLTEDEKQILTEFQSLVESKGWELLVDIAQAQINNRLQTLRIVPVNGEDDRKQIAERGVMEGIELFLKLPYNVIESGKEAQKQEGNDNEIAE